LVSGRGEAQRPFSDGTTSPNFFRARIIKKVAP